jgi:hypothetical protein
MERDAEALHEPVAGIEERIRCPDTLEIGTLVDFQRIWSAEEQPGARVE